MHAIHMAFPGSEVIVSSCIRAGAIAVIGALFAGCAAAPSTIETASSRKAVPLASAFVLPPPGGPAILDVSERRYANGREQQIALATNSGLLGQNSVRARIYGKVERQARDLPNLPGSALANTAMSGEIRDATGIPMQKAPYYVQNRYGPFGYAMGRSKGDLCMYAWQQIKAAPGFGGNKGRIDVRVRLCDRDGSESRLLAFMYGYTIPVYLDDSRWNPYGEPAPPAADLGGKGADIYPLGSSRFEQVTRTPPSRPRPAPKRPTPRVVPEEAPAELPEPTGPTVPPPTAESGAIPIIPAPGG